MTSLVGLCGLTLIVLTLMYPKRLLNLYNHTVLIVCLGLFHGYKSDLYSVECLVQKFETLILYLNAFQMLGVLIVAPLLFVGLLRILKKFTTVTQDIILFSKLI